MGLFDGLKRVAERRAIDGELDKWIGGLHMSKQWDTWFRGLAHAIVGALITGTLIAHTGTGAVDWKMTIVGALYVAAHVAWSYVQQEKLPDLPK